MQGVEFTVPGSLDEIPQLLFLDLHQLIGIVMLAALGLLAGSMLAGMVLGGLFAKGYAWLRAGRHPRFFMHLAYWHLPSRVLPLRGLPPAHLRVYVG